MKKLIIIGAGMYGLLVKEIADSMGCYESISFADDNLDMTNHGDKVFLKLKDIKHLNDSSAFFIVAIGNSKVRRSILDSLIECGANVETLISPYAYVSPSATVGEGCIIEPMAVLNTDVVLGSGCIVSAGAVLNHACVCERCVHIDCNATVSGYSRVPEMTKVDCGKVFREQI